jgi:hypothetical protein
MIKTASIYKKENKYVIHAYSTTTSGLSISSEPYFILDSDNTNAEEICKYIFIALLESRIGVKHPTDWKLQSKLFFENMKEKSMKTLHSNNAISCDITEENGNIILYPMVNLGSKEGFGIIPNLEITIPQELLIDNIYTALNLCK